MIRGTFVSDLHHFSSRSQTERYQQPILLAARESDLLVLGGDIFDFRWTTLGSVDRTIHEAITWLKQLHDANPSCRIVYVLGNHDYHESFIAALCELEAEVERFACERFFLRAGDCLFLHGDACDGFATPETLKAHREHWDSAIRSRLKSEAYRLATRLRVHVPIVHAAHAHRKTTQEISRYLTNIGQDESSGVRRVFFGHTHRAVSGYKSGELTFYNGGAPMDGLRFELLRFEIDE